MSEEKSIIAKNASQLIKDGDIIFLDSSSSAFHLLPHLKKFHNITVCTNGLKTAVTLGEMNIKTICLGGDVSSYNLSCSGHEGLDMIRNFRADILFFSCDALNGDGLLSDNSREASYIRREFIKNSKVKVLLVDGSKLNKQCWHNLCSLNEIDYCFCDKPLPEKLKLMLKVKQ
jgi:DeoR/GlpR family transcriptional regulator of sugar metabolism